VLHRTLALAVMFLTALASAHAAPPPAGSVVVYGGRLVDANGRPVTGIFPLTFNLYGDAKTKRPAWSDSAFVAVDNGIYAVELGRKKALPAKLDLAKAEIGIAMTGKKKEIVREALEGTPAVTPDAPVVLNPTPVAGGGVKPSAGSQQTYADLAGYAYEAERARVADRIGGMTETDLRELAKSAAGAGAAPTAAKVRIGDEKRFTESAGGSDGRPYSISCPPGFVVTGIRGGAGALVDSVALICSPLE
jgi:hypothetical protein